MMYSWGKNNWNKIINTKNKQPKLKYFPMKEKPMTLNSTLVKLHWAYSLLKANQMMEQGLITLNNHMVTNSNFILTEGTLVKPSLKGFSTILKEYMKISKSMKTLHQSKPLIQSWMSLPLKPFLTILNKSMKSL